MHQMIGRFIVILLLAAFCSGCAPKTKTRTRTQPVTPREESTYRGGSQKAGTRTAPVNYSKLEQTIPNLKARTDKALTLIEKAHDLKKKYDVATGAERKKLGEQIQVIYQEAGDIHDEILMDVDDIQEKEGIKDDLLMRRGRVLSSFSSLWEKRSKAIVRMAFR